MTAPRTGELLRAPIFHTPRNPFRRRSRAGSPIADGASADPRWQCSRVRRLSKPPRGESRCRWRRPARAVSCCPASSTRTSTSRNCACSAAWAGPCSTGWSTVALPEEARMADASYALPHGARNFVRALASHGTTTALVLARISPPPPRVCSKPRRHPACAIISGLVLSDRLLRPELASDSRVRVPRQRRT